MNLLETRLPGAFVVELDAKVDERGFFARTFDAKVFGEHGLVAEIAQTNLSYNRRAGTLRGMHYQLPPAAESKLVRCTAGAVYDVIVDLRPGSATFGEHVGVELTAQNRRALYVPPLFAHGYQTLVDRAEVAYQVGEFYTPGFERGARHDDPALGIEWPLEVAVISQKDSAWPDFDRERVEGELREALH